MSAGVDIKPSARKRPRRAPQGKLAIIAATTCENLELSEDERQLIKDFRRMGRAGRDMLPRFAHAIAQQDAEKARKSAPALRLIQGGTDMVALSLKGGAA